MLDFQLAPNFVSAQKCFDLYLAPFNVVLFVTNFQCHFLEGAPRYATSCVAVMLWVWYNSIAFRLRISTAHSSTASITSVFLLSVAICVLPVGLSPLFDVAADSDSGVVVVPVGVVITTVIVTGGKSVNPDTTV
jgi:hypothetical protein